MGAIKRNIPNFITCLNLVSGCVGLILVFNNKPIYASYAMFIAAFFDFLDGLIARALKVTSPIGKDLDSLADVVTFGVLPGMMAMSMVIASQNIDLRWAFLCLIIPVFSALRLAIFNNDSGQSYSFKGLATPANGLFWACINICFFKVIYSSATIGLIGIDFIGSKFTLMEGPWIIKIIDKYPAIILVTATLLSFLLVSKIRLLAFKIQHFSFKNYMWHFILLILSGISAVLFGFASAPIILILYILISQIHFRTKKDEIQS